MTPNMAARGQKAQRCFIVYYFWFAVQHSLVANATRLDDCTATRRLNALADHAAIPRISVVVTPIVAVTIVIITIGIWANAYAHTDRSNLHAHALRVRRG